MTETHSSGTHTPGTHHSGNDEREADAGQALLEALQHRADAGEPVALWLRDDDAVEPGDALDELLGAAQKHQLPITLAIIPAFSGDALAQRLQGLASVSVAVHGWAHQNHAPPEEKKQELGVHRPLEETLDELQRGLQHLQQWHQGQCVPLLVPPWNRIAGPLVPALQSIGFKGLSTFADDSFESIRMVNTHVDIIDWKGNRGGRPTEVLLAELTAQVLAGRHQIGILTHHLVHDRQAWRFLEQLFQLTAEHPGVAWQPVDRLLSAALPDPGLPGQQ